MAAASWSGRIKNFSKLAASIKVGCKHISITVVAQIYVQSSGDDGAVEHSILADISIGTVNTSFNYAVKAIMLA